MTPDDVEAIIRPSRLSIWHLLDACNGTVALSGIEKRYTALRINLSHAVSACVLPFDFMIKEFCRDKSRHLQ